MDLSLGVNDLAHGCSSTLRGGLRAFHTVDNVTGDLNVIILENKMSENGSLADPGTIKLTANSPISASSIPIISSSSGARKLRPGMRFITKRIMQVPKKAYAIPETESASWYPNWI